MTDFAEQKLDMGLLYPHGEDPCRSEGGTLLGPSELSTRLRRIYEERANWILSAQQHCRNEAYWQKESARWMDRNKLLENRVKMVRKVLDGEIDHLLTQVFDFIESNI